MELLVILLCGLVYLATTSALGKGNFWAAGCLDLLFRNNNLANVGDATGLRGSSTAGSLYVSLHTADPGAAGSQNTSEASYTGYARVAIARSSGGWTLTGETITPAATIVFGACTAGTNTITHFAIGTASSGAGNLLYSGTVTPNIAVAAGITPELTTASTVIES